MYSRFLDSNICIRSTREQDTAQLEQLQIKVFSTLADSQRLKAEHYKRHIEMFAEGQFVAACSGRIIAMTSSIRLSENFLNNSHNFDDIIGGGYCSSHDPQGQWLYGIDMGTDPEFRGRGLARALYAARQHTVRHLGLKGQYTVGMPSGYGVHINDLSPEQYYEKIVSGEISDPTISAQMKIGFQPKGIIKNYLQDPGCGNCGVILVLPANVEIETSNK